MINYENAVGTDSTAVPTITHSDTKQDQSIHRLETLVVTQNQKIEVLEREMRRLKNDLRLAIAAFNSSRASQ
jgi:uncharacterized coiled-coil protein SlyX